MIYLDNEGVFVDTLDGDIAGELDYSKLVSKSIDAGSRTSSICVHILLTRFKRWSLWEQKSRTEKL